MQFLLPVLSLLAFGILGFFMYRDIKKHNSKPKTKKKRLKARLPEYKGKF